MYDVWHQSHSLLSLILTSDHNACSFFLFFAGVYDEFVALLPQYSTFGINLSHPYARFGNKTDAHYHGTASTNMHKIGVPTMIIHAMGA
jgi:hypothetical protein